MKKLIKWGLIAFVVIGGIGALSGSGKESSSSTPAGDKKEGTTQPTYKTNDVIAAKNMEITITSVTQKNSVGGQYFNEAPSEGATLVVVQWQYKNISDKPLKSYSFPSIKLTDQNGTEYRSDIGKTSTYATEIKLDRKLFSDLNPGITVKDAEVFEISKETYSKGGWKVRINADSQTYSVEL